ncbi:CPBP family intramembrane glutamic endopeptidase [Anaerococcus cruorum]|uniref:CPBP family intramembrane glutamic endopeptidase n=1 Tax=Anaerococcus sp. WGS1596 TaxID=3366806 RepID=UPI00372D841B
MKKVLKLLGILLATMAFVLGTEALTSVLLVSISKLTSNGEVDLIEISKYQIIFGQLLRLILMYLFVVLINKKRTGKNNIKINYQGFLPDSWKMLVIGLGVAGLGNWLISLLFTLIGDLPSVTNTVEQFNNAFQLNGSLDFFLMLLGAVVLAPISEEILFRGLVFEKLKSIYTLPWAIVLSGVIFGIYHMNILQGINTFVMGMVLAFVYYYRRNIMDAILIHIVNNFFALTVGLNETVGLITTVVSTLCIFLAIKYLKEFKKEVDEKSYI